VVVAGPVAIAVTAVAPAAIRDPKHAFDSANGSADTGSDRAANHAADWACDTIALIGAFLGAAHDAL
jgi:hypothetical protein